MQDLMYKEYHTHKTHTRVYLCTDTHHTTFLILLVDCVLGMTANNMHFVCVYVCVRVRVCV